MAKQTIGEFLATQRKAKGYTQQYVADFLGISNRTLSAWETNKAYPDILTLPALAELYGVTCDEILNGERNANKSPEPEISEKAQNKLYKSKLAKNSPKYTALMSAGSGSAILFTLGVGMFFIFGIDYDLQWLNILFILLGVIGTAVIFTLITVFVKSTLSSTGIYSEAPAPNEKNFILNVINQGVQVSDIVSYAWLGCGVLYSFLWFLIYGINDNFADPYPVVAGALIFFWIIAAIALIILIIANVIKIKAIKRYGTEQQIKDLKYNCKLLGLCSLSLIPFLIYTFWLLIYSLNDGIYVPILVTTMFVGIFVCIAVGITVFCLKRKKLKIAI